MIVATVPDRSDLGQAMADELGSRHVEFATKRFPDGEGYVRLETSVEDVAVVAADLRPDASVVQTLAACDAAREAGAEDIVLAVPYLAYGRQDQAFEPGEGVSVRALLRALSANADALATVDPHTEAALTHFQGPAQAAIAAPEIAQAFADAAVDVVLAPDEGARGRAAAVADRLDCPHDHLEKQRRSAREVEIEPHDRSVDGERVLVVDDIVATGGTMAAATRQLLDAGASDVLLAATHGIFADGAIKRLRDAGAERVVSTDAIPTDASELSAAPALARATRRTLQG
jgi:ribose-phosphate pyrophosphokinase